MPQVPLRWFEIQHHRLTVPDEVVFRELAGEVVVLNIKSGRYHRLDGVAGRFFEAMREERDVASACDALAAAYGQPRDQIRSDFAQFLGELSARGLITVSPPPDSTPLSET